MLHSFALSHFLTTWIDLKDLDNSSLHVSSSSGFHLNTSTENITLFELYLNPTMQQSFCLGRSLLQGICLMRLIPFCPLPQCCLPFNFDNDVGCVPSPLTLDETSYEAGIKVQLHSQSEPPFLHELGFGVAPGFQTFISTQEQRVVYVWLGLLHAAKYHVVQFLHTC